MKSVYVCMLVASLALASVTLAACSGEQLNSVEQQPDPFLAMLPAILDQPATAAEAERIFAYDATQPLDVRIEGESRLRDVIQVDLSFESPMGGRVPAFLWRPASSDGPLPALVGLHGLPGDRHQMRETGVAYAEAGAILIGISGPTGRPDNNRRFVSFNPEQAHRDQIQLIVDIRRALDLLEARDDVDPDRIVFIGGSYGGAMGGLVAGVEHRFKAFVLMTGDGGVMTHVARGWSEEATSPEQDRWMETMATIEPIRFVGLANGRPLLFQNSNLDQYVHREDALRYHAAASEPKTVRWYDYDHFLGTAAFEEGAAWLQPIINIDLDRFRFPPDLGDLH